jgi:beta-lactamase class D
MKWIKIMIKQQKFLLLTIIVLGLFACKGQQPSETRIDFKKFYDDYNVEGSFVLYDQSEAKYTFYNESQFKQQFSPASTFKICNSLIGLETGVIKNENFVIPWDSVVRRIPVWNQDQNLKSAFKNSTVWYYQELARRVGGERMKYWLDKANYGNADTSGGIDKFWLTGGLRITPEQQINFLRRLHDNNLPFSQRSMDIVKNIMIVRDTLGFIVRAKTGWGDQDNLNIGWYVGYVQTKDNVYYFVNCIQTVNSDNPDFAGARIDITNKILAKLKIIND